MSVFLQARYLIFLLPLGVSVFLLVLSLLFSGGDNDTDGTEGGDGDGSGVDGDADSDAGDSDGDDDADSGSEKAAPAPRGLLLNGFTLAWGVFGIGANQLLFPGNQEPPFARWWPALLIALIGGLIGARLMRHFARRLMPGVQTQTVSRDALFGLTGTLLFAATETGGRIRVYDEFNTFHDEPCRAASGAPAIAKGKKARIVDRDTTGRLVVDEVL